jgi:diguanylate cyclase (GGDEF)-like protein/PAS domain S-box-containing protein
MLTTPILLLIVTTLLVVQGGLASAFLLRRQSSLRQRAESDAADSRARLVEIQELARIGNWEFDLIHDQIRWSAETFHIFGLPPGSEEPEFADVLLAVDPEDRPLFDAAIERAITEGRPYRLDLRIRTPEGTQKFIHAQGSAVYGAAGAVVRLIGTVLDITDRKREENRLAEQARRDTLTGLANRRYFSSELEHEIRASRDTANPLSVCICDIDKFKHVNDHYGHGAGDEVIRALARCLAEGVRRQDLAARWGGDEFCILFPGTRGADVQICVERIRQRLESLVFTTECGQQYSVTGTFGIAELEVGMSSADLLELADQALYRAKQQGRNRLALAG